MSDLPDDDSLEQKPSGPMSQWFQNNIRHIKIILISWCIFLIIGVIAYYYKQQLEQEKAEAEEQELLEFTQKEIAQEIKRIKQLKTIRDQSAEQQVQQRVLYASEIETHYGSLESLMQTKDYASARDKLEEMSQMGQFAYKDVQLYSRQITS